MSFAYYSVVPVSLPHKRGAIRLVSAEADRLSIHDSTETRRDFGILRPLNKDLKPVPALPSSIDRSLNRRREKRNGCDPDLPWPRVGRCCRAPRRLDRHRWQYRRRACGLLRPSDLQSLRR